MLPSSLRPLRHRNYALIWSAALVSNVGSWMQTVALGVLVTARTGKPLWTGLVAAAAFVPMGLMSPIGGALADRYDRRRWLLVTTIGETVFAAGLAALAGTGNARPAVAVVMAFFGGVCAAVGFPAYQAMLPDLVEPDDLLAAVSLSSAQYNMGRVVGPALAGVVLVLGSYELAFAVNAVSFAAVIVALALVRLPPPGSGVEARPAAAGSDTPPGSTSPGSTSPGSDTASASDTTPGSDTSPGSDTTPGPDTPPGSDTPPGPDLEELGIRSRIVEGARATVRIPGARSAVVFISLVAFLASPFIALVPAMAFTVLGSKAGGTSALVTAQGIGAVAGAISVAPLASRVGRYRIVVSSLVALPVTLVLYGLAPDLPLSVAGIFLVGFAYIGVLSGLNTVVQMSVPSNLRGRALGFYMMALGTIYPIGAVVQGAIGDAAGVRAVTIVGALVLFVVLEVVATVKREWIESLKAIDAHLPPAST